MNESKEPCTKEPYITAEKPRIRQRALERCKRAWQTRQRPDVENASFANLQGSFAALWDFFEDVGLFRRYVGLC